MTGQHKAACTSERDPQAVVLWSTRKAELKLQMPQGQSREDSEDLIDVLRLCPGGNKWASEIFKQVSGMSRLVFGSAERTPLWRGACGVGGGTGGQARGGCRS